MLDVKKADARNRALRTFVQNLGIDLALSLIGVVMVALPTMDVTSKEAWTALGILLLKTLISAPISYFARLKRDPKLQAVVDLPATDFKVVMTKVDQGQEYNGRG